MIAMDIQDPLVTSLCCGRRHGQRLKTALTATETKNAKGGAVPRIG